MLGRMGICFLGVVLVVLPLSCAKLPQSLGPGEGDVLMEELPQADSIPAKWGNLVSVSNLPDYKVSQLWFQDQEGNVRMVGYNFSTNEFLPNARLIRRN